MSISWMIKLCGGVLVFSACVMTGLGRARLARRREVLLGEMSLYLSLVRAELTYRKNRSQQLLRHALSTGRWREMKLSFDGDAPFTQSLEKALDRFSCFSSSIITPQERDLFCDALRCVGMQDASEQSEHLSYASAMLEQARGHARKKADEEIRIYRALGISGGCAALLFLL